MAKTWPAFATTHPNTSSSGRFPPTTSITCFFRRLILDRWLRPDRGDKKVQAYNFRLILTNDPANRLPFPRPEGYDRARFALLERYLNEFQQHMGRAPGFRDVTNPVMIPNHKADFNNNGPVSTDYIGHSWKYPEANYAEKAALWQDHLLYTQSFFISFRRMPRCRQACGLR